MDIYDVQAVSNRSHLLASKPLTNQQLPIDPQSGKQHLEFEKSIAKPILPETICNGRFEAEF